MFKLWHWFTLRITWTHKSSNELQPVIFQPHLHTIVNRSMELALTAKEPYNYFLLLRALFRSIGGGSHDLLYQEFLPLLPSLLQGLVSTTSHYNPIYIGFYIWEPLNTCWTNFYLFCYCFCHDSLWLISFVSIIVEMARIYIFKFF